jgi:predicted transcriptional regulator
MRVRHGHIVPESASLRSVAERLMISDCDVMAVTDSHGRLRGTVCESSVVRALMANPAEDATIQSIMSRHADSVRLNAPLASVIPLFRSSANTAVAVIDENDCVCGLLVRRDVIGSLLCRRADSPDAAPTAEEQSAAKTPGPSSPIRPPQTRVIHSAESDTTESSTSQQKPHFLRADEARRILWAAEDRL